MQVTVCEGFSLDLIKFLVTMVLLGRSTDSEMKLWDVNTNRCLKTYHGHKNDKNSVGLTVNGNHIVCGR